MRRLLSVVCCALGLMVVVALPRGEATFPGVDGVLIVWGIGPEGYGLHAVDLEWSLVTRLPVDTDEMSSLAWSPDGAHIAFTRAESDLTDRDVWIMDADGSAQTVLVEAGPYESLEQVAWSPTGDRLVVVAQRKWQHPDGAGPLLLTVDLDGNRLTPLALDVTFMDVQAIEWSPDGQSLLLGLLGYPTDFDTTVAVVDLATLQLRGLARGQNPSWSPDGERIVFNYVEGDDLDSRVATAVMDADGCGFSTFPELTGTWASTWGTGGDVGWYPVWSPDGTRIVYAVVERFSQHLETMNPDGSGSLRHDLGFESITALWWQPLVPTSGFVDVIDAHPFTGDIAWMGTMGVTAGCNPPIGNRFCPDRPATRGEVAAFLVRALGYTDDRGGDLFIDDDESIFETDIDRLKAAGVALGCNPPDNSKYCPDDHVTRGQMAAFLVRALGYTDDGGGNLFVDDDDSIFEADIDKLGTAGVTLGCNPPDNTKYCPASYVTRGQMAAFLHRALGTD